MLHLTRLLHGRLGLAEAANHTEEHLSMQLTPWQCLTLGARETVLARTTAPFPIAPVRQAQLSTRLNRAQHRLHEASLSHM